MYCVTGAQRRTIEGSNGACAFFGSRYLRKYQDESTNVSIVSVSRRAGPPHVGHVVRTNDSTFSRGFPPCPVKGASGGRTTGSSLSGTGTQPSFSQRIIGIGVPQ